MEHRRHNGPDPRVANHALTRRIRVGAVEEGHVELDRGGKLVRVWFGSYNVA